MHNTTGKYHWLSLLPTPMLEIIAEQGFVPYEIAIKYNVLNLQTEALPRIKGTATYYLNQRQGKHKERTPAQARGNLLGRTKFALTGVRGQIKNLSGQLMQTADTDIALDEIYELKMQVNWLLSEVDITLDLLAKLNAAKAKKEK